MRITWVAAAAAVLMLSGVLAACGKEEAVKTTQSTEQGTAQAGAGTETADSDSTGNGKGEYQKLTAKEAKERIDSGNDIIILDVRTEAEFKEKHIPGAVLIPNEEIGDEPVEQLPDLEQEILIYCRSGNRSAQAAKKLIQAGYKNVYDFGGIHDWPYETESGDSDASEASQDETSGSEVSSAVDESGSAAGEADASGGLFGAFTSQTLEGEEITEEVFTEADLTMVNIWGTFCGPCIREMPDLGELSREYADQGMQIVGIVSDIIDPEDEAAHDIVSTTEADYTHIVLSEELYNNYLSQVSVVPTTIFVDKNGNQVGKVYAGAKSKDKWKGIIDENLKQVQE